MRRISIVILCIALCTTLIVPVSARKSSVTLTGAVDWSGYADVRNTKNCIEIKIYSKKPFPTPITFTHDWPWPLSGVSTDNIESSIYINKKNDVVKMSFSWGEYNPSITEYVLQARGTATYISDTRVDIAITEVKISERVKPNSFITVHYSTGNWIVFKILFI